LSSYHLGAAHDYEINLTANLEIANLHQKDELREKQMNLLEKLENRSKLFLIAAGSALVGGIGLLDYLTGAELAFSLFYLIPISMVAWLTGQWFGVIMSIVSASVWLVADIAAGNSYSHPLIFVWNTLIRFGFFVVVTMLLSFLKKSLEHEKELARIDHKTGAVNSRFFLELLQMEINRLQRYKHPFTLAYFDLDNFKSINDHFGHAAGDEVLRLTVRHASEQLRKTDIIARLGGDEFALLLPETNQETAQIILLKVQDNILEGMRKNNVSSTLSIGVITCLDALPTADEIIRLADKLMYSIKLSGKNSIKYSSFEI
jgi:diguanylate cyclase (GGDEF)-like protein